MDVLGGRVSYSFGDGCLRVIISVVVVFFGKC